LIEFSDWLVTLLPFAAKALEAEAAAQIWESIILAFRLQRSDFSWSPMPSF